jgi:hypothetical protein
MDWCPTSVQQFAGETLFTHLTRLATSTGIGPRQRCQWAVLRIQPDQAVPTSRPMMTSG